MSASDSDGETFYNSIVRNLTSIRDQYRNQKTAEKLVIADEQFGNNSNVKNNTGTAANDSLIDLLSEDGLVDEIIAKNSKPNSKRKRKQNIDNQSEFEDVNNKTKVNGGRKRGRGSKSNVSDGTRNIANSFLGNLTNLSGKAKKDNTHNLRSRNKASNNTSMISQELNDTNRPHIQNRLEKRAKNSSKNDRDSFDDVGAINSRVQRGRSPARSRSKGKKRGRGMSRNTEQSHVYPIYSVGNTYEYPDQSAEVELFSSKPTKDTKDVIVIDDEVYDDNEELSVKVIWQGFDIFRFTIYKYEKLNKIFDSFMTKENVSSDKLLFTYNEKIVTVNDTPASIGYNVAKFINGGHNRRSALSNGNIESGPKIKIKFQCQKMKKPFDVLIPKNENLLLAMSKCAEHLNLPLGKLKFNFDGDIVLGTSMPQDIELENGDCIDVIILS